MQVVRSQTKTVHVKKDRQCYGCMKIILSGEKAVYNSGLIEGEGYFKTWMHPACEEFMHDKDSSFTWQDYDEGMSKGDLLNHDDFAEFIDKNKHLNS